jgi:hypothetical protein
MAEPEVRDFLTFLAMDRNVAASTQNQALNAIVFLYKQVLNQPLGKIEGITRSKVPKRLAVVLSRDEIRKILFQLNGSQWLADCLLIYTHILQRGGAGVQSPLSNVLKQ